MPQWERDASARLRAGDFSVVAAYDRRGRIRGGDREAAFDRAAGAWLADHLHGRDTILLAGSNEEAAELARRVQAQLVHDGDRGAAPCTARGREPGRHRGPDPGPAQHARSTPAGSG